MENQVEDKTLIKEKENQVKDKKLTEEKETGMICIKLQNEEYKIHELVKYKNVEEFTYTTGMAESNYLQVVAFGNRCVIIGNCPKCSGSGNGNWKTCKDENCFNGFCVKEL